MIYSYSAWYYGLEITGDNQIISFSENGGPELLGFLNAGKYTLTDLAAEVARAMNSVAEDNQYSVSIDRVNRIYTIYANNISPVNFVLKVSSGTSGNSAYSTIGFVGSDKSGGTTYTGSLSVGSSYTSQFRLQDFVNFDDNQKAQESSVLTSATGEVEVIKFGNVKIMECNLMFITDIEQDVGSYIRSSSTGVDDARAFLLYAITKGPMEFIPDITDTSIFTKCILETTPEGPNGTAFKLKEEYSRGLPGYYQTGKLTFRKVE